MMSPGLRRGRLCRTMSPVMNIFLNATWHATLLVSVKALKSSKNQANTPYSSIIVHNRMNFRNDAIFLYNFASLRLCVRSDGFVKSRKMKENHYRGILSLSKDVCNYAYFDKLSLLRLEVKSQAHDFLRSHLRYSSLKSHSSFRPVGVETGR